MKPSHTDTHQHFMMYKPYGYISQFVINGKQKRQKKLLGELYDFPANTMAIGRLDEKSEGLLLLTTHGKVSTYFTSSGMEKEYYVLVDGAITDTAILALQNGVEIGFEGKKYTTKPCKVKKLVVEPNLPERSKKIRDDRHGPTTWLSITVTEGKFRQLRKMTSAVGYPTLRLVRIRIGTILLNELQPGVVKELKALVVTP